MWQQLTKLLTKNFKAMKKLHKLITVILLVMFMSNADHVMGQEDDFNGPLSEIIKILKNGGATGPFYPYIGIINKEKNDIDIKASDLYYVGEEHNRILDLVYNKMKNDKSYIFDKNKLVNLLSSYDKTDDDLQRNNNLILIRDVLLNRDVKHVKTLVDNFVRKNDNDYFSKYYSKIVEISNLKNDFIKKNLELEKTIENEKKLNYKEKVILLSFLIVNRFSYNYWLKNKDKWMVILNKNNHKGCCDGIAAADGYGAAAGALGALAVNIIPGGGQIAYCGAIIFEGVGNSILAIIE